MWRGVFDKGCLLICVREQGECVMETACLNDSDIEQSNVLFQLQGSPVMYLLPSHFSPDLMNLYSVFQLMHHHITSHLQDLHRTGCSSYCGQEGEQDRVVLKRVLLAYARWNKNVGYCQGFNVLAALILEVTEGNESDALKVHTQ